MLSVGPSRELILAPSLSESQKLTSIAARPTQEQGLAGA